MVLLEFDPEEAEEEGEGSEEDEEGEQFAAGKEGDEGAALFDEVVPPGGEGHGTGVMDGVGAGDVYGVVEKTVAELGGTVVDGVGNRGIGEIRYYGRERAEATTRVWDG